MNYSPLSLNEHLSKMDTPIDANRPHSHERYNKRLIVP